MSPPLDAPPARPAALLQQKFQDKSGSSALQTSASSYQIKSVFVTPLPQRPGAHLK
jgi:hypothetical protein